MKENTGIQQTNVPLIVIDQRGLVLLTLLLNFYFVKMVVEHVNQNKGTNQDEDYTLSAKQVEYALFLIEKVKEEFELAIETSKLTIKDLNRLIAYNRYKNKGTLINLVKKGVLRKKNKLA